MCNNDVKSLPEINVEELKKILQDETLDAKNRLRASELLLSWQEILEAQSWTC